MKNFLSHLKSGHHKGQSFVELAIVTMVLVGMFVGMVEAGNLLNQYINIVDGAREGARGASNSSPFIDSTNGNYSYQPTFYDGIDKIIEGVLVSGQIQGSAIAPLKLDPTAPALDDIVISVYAAAGRTVTQSFPKYAELPAAHKAPTNCNCWSAYGKRAAQITQAQITTELAGLVNAPPDSGLVVVEIFYSYPTILRVPQRIGVYAYVIMPLSAAEPTPVP